MKAAVWRREWPGKVVITVRNVEGLLALVMENETRLLLFRTRSLLELHACSAKTVTCPDVSSLRETSLEIHGTTASSLHQTL